MKFEDILQQIGAEDRYQILLIILLLLPTSFFNVYFEGLFLLSTPDHWCRVPELEHLPIKDQHLLIRPVDELTGKKASCKRYNIEWPSHSPNLTLDDLLKHINLDPNDKLNTNLSDYGHVECKQGWTFEQTLYTETAVTWFNFVCNQDYYVNLIMSLSAIGLAVLTPLLSNLSDSIGRRKALLITLIMAEISCLSPIIFKDIYSFIIGRFLAGGVFCIFYQLPFVITQELVNQKYRTRSSCISGIFYSLGSCSVTLALKLTGNWVTFSWIPFIFTSFIIIGFKWIPESPSWLISKKRYEEAYEQLVLICKCNNRKVPEDLMENIKSLENENSEKEDDSFFDLIVRPGLRTKTLYITIVFIACIIGYGGIIANTVNLEASNQLYNYLLLSFIDLPSLFICWKLINTPLGRRWTNVISMALCGVSLMVPSLHPTYDEHFYTICTLIAKFGVAGTFMIIYQHSSELYPTTLRNQGIGLTATIGSIGGIIVPQIVYIAKFGQWIPLFVIGIMCLFAAFIASLLPETLNEYLPQRAQQAADFGKDKPYFSLANMRRPTAASISIVLPNGHLNHNEQQQTDEKQATNNNNNDNNYQNKV